MNSFNKFLIVLAILVGAVGFISFGVDVGLNYAYADYELPENCKVFKVLDGDTFYCHEETTGEVRKIRIIGIDTPEKEYKSKRAKKFADKYNLPIEVSYAWGLTAKQYATRILMNKNVYLVYDKGKTGYYRRTLAYVYRDRIHLPGVNSILGSDGRVLFNAEMIRLGLAVPKFFSPNYAMRDYLTGLGEIAKKNRRGMWLSVYAYENKEN